MLPPTYTSRGLELRSRGTSSDCGSWGTSPLKVSPFDRGETDPMNRVTSSNRAHLSWLLEGDDSNTIHFVIGRGLNPSSDISFGGEDD
jgi:hypothetical protein